MLNSVQIARMNQCAEHDGCGNFSKNEVNELLDTIREYRETIRLYLSATSRTGKMAVLVDKSLLDTADERARQLLA